MKNFDEEPNISEQLAELQNQIDELQLEKELLKIRLENLRSDMTRTRRDFSIYVSRMMLSNSKKYMS
jgi:hypothetical protein